MGTTVTTERKYIVALNLVEGVGSIRMRRLIEAFGGADKALGASEERLTRVEGIGKDIARAVASFKQSSLDEELRIAEETNTRIAFPEDDQYPLLLKTIHDPPPVLYMNGAEKIPDGICLGIVGTRRASEYGISAVKHLIRGLADTRLPFNIISGMAAGIDTAAHEQAVKEGLFTAAVLGFGIGTIYPFKQKRVMEAILANGVFVSEFPMRMEGAKPNFPRRNRVISGISRGIVVAEAGEKSGALITADMALEQGRDVFAFPGEIFSEGARGTNRLIRQGARLVESAADVLEEFGIDTAGGSKRETQPNLPLVDLTPDEEKVFKILTLEKKHVDNIAFESNMDIIKLSRLLTNLEIKGVIRQQSGKNFSRAR